MSSQRRGVVLGAGGVLGFAWSVGVLAALVEVEGWDPREAEILVGTSAGSVLAGMLGAGVGVDSLLNHQRGLAVEGDPHIAYDYDRDSGGALPPRPKLRLGSRKLAVGAAMRPWRVTPMAAVSSMLPQGRGSLEPVGLTIDAIVERGSWAPHPRTWIVAMDYDSGRRVPFGREGSPPAALRDAVMASCSIPGWYAPMQIGGRRYVDGGACSPTSLDLCAGRDLDEVVVIAPMIAFDYDSPATVAARLERRFRRIVSKRVLREAEKVRRSGTPVRIFAPGAEDLQAIGPNMMDPRRREHVLETSIRTSADQLRRPSAPSMPAAG